MTGSMKLPKNQLLTNMKNLIFVKVPQIIIQKKLYIPQIEFVPTIEKSKQCMKKSTHFLERSVLLVNHNIYNFLRAIWQKKYMVLSNFSATHFFMMLIVVNNFTKSQKHNVYWNKQFCDRHELVLCITCKFQYILKCSDQLFLFSWIFYPCWFMRSYGLKYIVIAHHVWIADRHNIYQFLNLITRQNVL